MKTRKTKNKVTLTKIADDLAMMKQGIDQELVKLNQGLNELRQDVKVLRQDVKGINTRLDYIVKANNLKDLPNSKVI